MSMQPMFAERNLATPSIDIEAYKAQVEESNKRYREACAKGTPTPPPAPISYDDDEIADSDQCWECGAVIGDGPCPVCGDDD